MKKLLLFICLIGMVQLAIALNYGEYLYGYGFYGIGGDSTLPNVKLLAPSNNSYGVLDVNVTKQFNASCSDNINKTMDIFIYINNTQYYSEEDYINNTIIEVNVTLEAGFYEWNVSCADPFGNNATAHHFYLIRNDTVAPNSFFNNLSLFGEYRKIGINASDPIYFNSTDNLNTTLIIEITMNDTIIYFNDSYTNGTLEQFAYNFVTAGYWLINLSSTDPYNNINWTTHNIRFDKVNTSFVDVIHPNITNLSYSPNWTMGWNQLNFSIDATLAGNFTWNFTEYNISNYEFNLTETGNTTPWTFNVTNNGSFNIEIRLQQNQTKDWYEWDCYNKNITNVSTPLFNLTVNQSIDFNCTLDVLNISQTYSEWNFTIDRAYWDFNWTFTGEFMG